MCTAATIQAYVHDRSSLSAASQANIGMSSGAPWLSDKLDFAEVNGAASKLILCRTISGSERVDQFMSWMVGVIDKAFLDRITWKLETSRLGDQCKPMLY